MKLMIISLLILGWGLQASAQISEPVFESTFEDHLEDFGLLIRASYNELELSTDVDHINVIGQQVQQSSISLIEMVRDYYSCHNPDMETNLALAVSLEAACTGCGTTIIC